MSTDDIIISLVKKNGRNIKDIELLKQEFMLTVYGGELRLVYRGRPL